MEENVSGCFFFWTQCIYSFNIFSFWSSTTHLHLPTYYWN